MCKARVTKITPVDDGHQVVTIEGGNARKYMKKPCPDCPWKKAATGAFPAEAFRTSAHTAYDMATHSFGCHSAGTENPKTCAGFLLQGADHNLGVRIRLMQGDYDLSLVSDGGHDLHENYRAMAIANGVDQGDTALAQCRD